MSAFLRGKKWYSLLFIALLLFGTCENADALAKKDRIRNLLKLYRASGIFARKDLAKKLVAFGSDAIEPIGEMIDDSKPEILIDLTKVLRDIQPDGFDLLRELAQHPVPDVRWAALDALASYGEKGLQVLMTALSAPLATTRGVAADAIGIMGSVAQKAVPNLERLTTDPEPFPKEAARLAVTELTSAKLKPLELTARHCLYPNVRFPSPSEAVLRSIIQKLALAMHYQDPVQFPGPDHSLAGLGNICVRQVIPIHIKEYENPALILLQNKSRPKTQYSLGVLLVSQDTPPVWKSFLQKDRILIRDIRDLEQDGTDELIITEFRYPSGDIWGMDSVLHFSSGTYRYLYGEQFRLFAEAAFKKAAYSNRLTFQLMNEKGDLGMIVTRFTNGFDPEKRRISRYIFHRFYFFNDSEHRMEPVKPAKP